MTRVARSRGVCVVCGRVHTRGRIGVCVCSGVRDRRILRSHATSGCRPLPSRHSLRGLRDACVERNASIRDDRW